MKCSKCGYENKEDAEHCELCKEVLIKHGNAKVIKNEYVNNSSSIRKMRFAGLWLKIGIIILVLGVLLKVCSLVIINSISGQVVDAVTGEPLSGIEVKLFTLSPSFGSIGFRPAGEYVTDRKGRFHFPHIFKVSYYRQVLLVNCKAGNNPLQIQNDILEDTFFNGEKHWDIIDNKNYFPGFISFLPGSNAKTELPFMGDMVVYYFPKVHNVCVALIPVLDNMSICDQIKDPKMKINCRQLNTFRSILLKLGTFKDMDKAKKLCNSIDPEDSSKECLRFLENYFAYRQNKIKLNRDKIRRNKQFLVEI